MPRIIKLCYRLYVYLYIWCIFAPVHCEIKTVVTITQNPSPLIIDGNRSVVLTCLADSPVPFGTQYLWILQPSTPLPCDENDVFMNNCTYKPQVKDAEKNVTCTASNPENSFVVLGKKQPEYFYPPQSAPNITVLESSSLSILNPDSVVKCEVRGGRPLVSNIVFTCDSPHHPDMPDEVESGCVASNVTLTNLHDEDGNMNCTCSATWEPFGNNTTTFTSSEIFTIKYLPLSEPIITAMASNRSDTNVTVEESVLGPGSLLKCEVRGGRPPVSNINFTCDSPLHPDMDDVAESWSVLSFINVTNLQDEDGNMSCSCSATWDPRPELYQNVSHASFDIAYMARVTNFTANKLHTREDANESITLYCVARGRPAPQVFLYDHTGHAVSSTVTSILSDVEVNSTAVISVTDCQQTGWYSCEANNSLPYSKTSSSLFINVACPPTALNDTCIDIPTMSDNEVLNFTLKANPPPHDFDFKLQTAPDSLYDFQAFCSCDSDRPYLARCSLVAVRVPSDYVGPYRKFYNATAISTEGNFSFSFLVNTTFLAEEANITSFSINNNSTLITPERSEQNVSLKCICKGRPTPNITFYDNTGARITSGFTSSTTGFQKEGSVTFSVTSCQQTGVYKCVANNALPNSQSESTVFVNVTAPPEAADSTFKDTIPIISLTSTLNFRLKANPTPHRFLFYESDAQIQENNARAFSDLTIVNTFNWSCSPDTNNPYLASCIVMAVEIPNDYLGHYGATVENTLGNFSFLFYVNTTILKDKVTEDLPVSSSMTILLAVIITVAVCVMAAAVFVIFWIRRLRSAKKRQDWHATTKTQNEATIKKITEPKMNTAKYVTFKATYDPDNSSLCNSNTEDENGSKINKEYLSSQKEEQTTFSISDSQKLAQQSPTPCFPNAATPYCITYVGDEPGAVPNLSATPYSVTYVGDEKITGSSGLPQSSPPESDLTVAVDDKKRAVLNNQTGQVAPSTNPYSEVNNHYEILPEATPALETKDFADGLYQLAFPPNGSTPSPLPFTPQAVPLHTEAGYAIPNLKKTVGVKETAEVSENNTINLASSSQAQGRDLDDTYDHLLSTDTTPL